LSSTPKHVIPQSPVLYTTHLMNQVKKQLQFIECYQFLKNHICCPCYKSIN
jgi:hypothetical protein